MNELLGGVFLVREHSLVKFSRESLFITRPTPARAAANHARWLVKVMLLHDLFKTGGDIVDEALPLPDLS